MIRFLAGAALAGLVALTLLYGFEDGALRAFEAERTQRTQIEQAERTQREALQQAGLTERAGINATTLMWLATEREATMRLIVVLLLVTVATTACIVVVVLVLRNDRRPGSDADELARRYLLSVQDQLPPYWKIEKLRDAGWAVVSGERYILARDVPQLLEDGRQAMVVRR